MTLTHNGLRPLPLFTRELIRREAKALSIRIYQINVTKKGYFYKQEKERFLERLQDFYNVIESLFIVDDMFLDEKKTILSYMDKQASVAVPLISTLLDEYTDIVIEE